MTKIATVLFLLIGFQAFASDPINPQTLCDRFLSGDEIKECEFRIKAIRPDWYLAAACQHQFDDQSFFECLSLSRNYNFNPRTIEKCESTELSDEQRMNCVHSVAIGEKKYSKTRMPASVKAKHHKTKKAKRHLKN
jgi:hypothetical protein